MKLTTPEHGHPPLEELRRKLADALEDLRSRLGDLKLHLEGHPCKELIPVTRHQAAVEEALAAAPSGRSADQLVGPESPESPPESLALLASLQDSAAHVQDRLCEYPFSFLAFLDLATLRCSKPRAARRWVEQYSQFLSECLRCTFILARVLQRETSWIASRE